MKDYDFTVKFTISDKNVSKEKITQKLKNSGCNDATFDVINNVVTVNFIRYSNTALEAISSGINDIKKAFPDIKNNLVC